MSQVRYKLIYTKLTDEIRSIINTTLASIQEINDLQSVVNIISEVLYLLVYISQLILYMHLFSNNTFKNTMSFWFHIHFLCFLIFLSRMEMDGISSLEKICSMP